MLILLKMISQSQFRKSVLAIMLHDLIYKFKLIKPLDLSLPIFLETLNKNLNRQKKYL